MGTRRLVVPKLSKRDPMADRVGKDETTPKKPKPVTRDLTPRNDPKGGGTVGFSKKPRLPIPPPGFISSPQNEPTQRDR